MASEINKKRTQHNKKTTLCITNLLNTGDYGAQVSNLPFLSDF